MALGGMLPPALRCWTALEAGGAAGLTRCGHAARFPVHLWLQAGHRAVADH
jgi:hypothetical protein